MMNRRKLERYGAYLKVRVSEIFCRFSEQRRSLRAENLSRNPQNTKHDGWSLFVVVIAS